MTAKKQLKQLAISVNNLLACIENEAWDEAELLSQQWDKSIRNLIRSLSAEQFIDMKSDIENIASQNAEIKRRLIKMRAKVLTLIQQNNNSRSALQLYNNSV